MMHSVKLELLDVNYTYRKYEEYLEQLEFDVLQEITWVMNRRRPSYTSKGKKL